MRARKYRKHPLAVSARASDSERAAVLSSAGSFAFGWLWIEANEAVIAIFREYDIDPEYNRALGMELATLVCRGPQRGS